MTEKDLTTAQAQNSVKNHMKKIPTLFERTDDQKRERTRE